jgi:hypothetical protein
MLSNEKYTGTVTLLDSATQEYLYQMKECHPPIITESEFRAVQEERKKRSNVDDFACELFENIVEYPGQDESLIDKKSMKSYKVYYLGDRKITAFSKEIWKYDSEVCR